MPNVHFRAVTDLRGQGKVQINGHDLSAVCGGFSVRTDPGVGHRITVELAAPDVNLNLESAEADLSDGAREALEALGWTHARHIAEAREREAEAARQARTAREAASAALERVEAQAAAVTRLEAENAALRRARTEDAAELARLREQLEPAATGEEN